MFDTWKDVKEFARIMLQLGCVVAIVMAVIVIGIAIFISIASALSGPLRTDYPAPLDVCPNTRINAVNQDGSIMVDYINLRGDTIYLTYKAYSAIDPDLIDRIVIEGDDCSQ